MDISDDEYYSDSEGESYVPNDGYAREADDLVDRMYADCEVSFLEEQDYAEAFDHWIQHYHIDGDDRWGYEEYEGVPSVKKDGAAASVHSNSTTQTNAAPQKAQKKKKIDPRLLEKVAVLKDWKMRVKEKKESAAGSHASLTKGEGPTKGKANVNAEDIRESRKRVRKTDESSTRPANDDREMADATEDVQVPATSASSKRGRLK